ncbi:MAG: 50S ribosomal protein L28 [Candidatus Blackburnbacteria bacterium]|nr:50S ribosomal protein L28 [Candidatus Blackburnbacteria bacterium]
MARICDRCGKGTLRGRQVSFSGKRSPRIFRPNLHFAWVVDLPAGRQGGGRRVRRRFCTKCLRIVRKAKQTDNPGAPQQIVAS